MERSAAFDSKRRDATPLAPAHGPVVINRTMSRRQWAVLLLLGLIWGGSFLFIKVGVTHVAPLTFVWLRVAIASLALLLFLRIRGAPQPIGRRTLGPLLVLALLNNVTPFLLFAWATTQMASGLASILNATTPVWGVLLAHFFTRDEPLSPARLGGVLLGFAGVAVMIAPGLTGGRIGLLAQVACLIGAFSYAVAGVYARRFRGMGIDPVAVTGGQLALSSLVILPFALLIEQPWLRPAPPIEAWTAIVALALICTAFAYVLYFRLIATAGASNALLVPILTPPTAILLGGLFLGEALHPLDFAGLALIALGLAAIDGRLFSFWRPRRQAA
jgi:drug/metabolite transporter (DMT)-like permease